MKVKVFAYHFRWNTTALCVSLASQVNQIDVMIKDFERRRFQVFGLVWVLRNFSDVS